jgi:hypothetical protein
MKENEDLDITNDINKSLANLKPRGPATSNQWLSNDEIDNVLKTYQSQHSNFKYYKSSLMNESVSSVNLNEDMSDSDIDHVAYVINTTEQCYVGKACGEHWVCIFVSKVGNAEGGITLEYFNSAGSAPPKRICELFKKQKYLLEMKYPVSIKYNRCQHQKGGSECGVYCLYFIKSRLEGTAFERFTNGSMISDEAMLIFRRYIFDIPSIRIRYERSF